MVALFFCWLFESFSGSVNTPRLTLPICAPRKPWALDGHRQRILLAALLDDVVFLAGQPQPCGNNLVNLFKNFADLHFSSLNMRAEIAYSMGKLCPDSFVCGEKSIFHVLYGKFVFFR